MSTSQPLKRPRAKASAQPKSVLTRSISRMLHAFGDSPSPLPEVVALVESHGVACACAILQALRALTGRSQLRIKDFVTLVPASTHVYFRWRRLKAMGTAGTEDVAGEPVEGEESLLPKGEEEEEGEEGEEEEEEEEAEDIPEEEEEEAERGAETVALRGLIAVDDEAAVSAAAAEEEEEDAEQIRLLEAAADEAARGAAAFSLPSEPVAAAAAAAALAALEGLPSAPLPSASASSSAAPSLHTPLAIFLARLAYANTRSQRMSSAQYAAYSHAREASMCGRGYRKFQALLPRPVLTRTALEIIGFLAYERVCCLVEEASAGGRREGESTPALLARILEASGAAGGAGGQAAAPVDEPPATPLATYQAVLAQATLLPAELALHLRVLDAEAANRAAGSALSRAREVVLAEGKGDRERADALESRWALGGGRDEAGEALLMAGLTGAAPAGVGAAAAAAAVAEGGGEEVPLVRLAGLGRGGSAKARRI